MTLRSGSYAATILESVCRAHPDGVSSDALIRQVWKDTPADLEQSRNRLYVALAKLRKRGIRFVVHHEGVYRVDPSTQVRIFSPEEIDSPDL